jgi:hypothetical protein
MTGLVFLVRFFRVVPPVPGLMIAAFAATVLAAGVALQLGASDVEGVLAPVFLLQTLAASSGFAVPARRGHYDLLLTRGISRLAIGLAHGVASILPGVCCWAAIAVIEAIAARGVPHVALASGTIAAVVIVSVLSWAVTVPLPRMTGGIVWLLVLVAPVDHGAVPAVAAALLLPSTLVGVDLVSLGVAPCLTAAVLVGLVVGSALTWICRTDISLQVAR